MADVSDARMCVSDRENLFCLDRVGVEEADGPVDGHECQCQYRVVDKGEPKHFQILILTFKTNSHLWHLSRRFFFFSLILSALKQVSKHVKMLKPNYLS